MRRTHVLRANESSEQPSNRVYVDTEAVRTPTGGNIEQQTLAFGWALYERAADAGDHPKEQTEWCRFTTSAQFWDWLESHTRPKATLAVYAHNWDYDGAMIEMESQAERRGWACRRYVRGQHFILARFARGSSRISFIDTLNYFPTSLDTLGRSLGVRKLPMPAADASADEWDTYCQQDVRVIQAAMRAFWAFVREHDLGKAALTGPGQAFSAFRHRFMDTKILILAAPEVSEIERESYHGGRTEVFYDRPLAENMYCLDVNSMYPAVMADGEYPTWKLARGRSLALPQLRALLDVKCVIARAHIETDAPCYPAVFGERLMFPVGRFWTTLSSPELRLALERGDIREIAEWVSYERAPLFARYVEYFYALRRQYREEGNEAFQLMTKLMLNGLYGKFGQNGHKWVLCPNYVESPVRDFLARCGADGLVLNHHTRYGDVLHLETEGEAQDSFPAIAAHVTAGARVRLWRLIEQAGRLNVYYVDTDSLYVNAEGRERLESELDAERLGALKVEKEADTAWFRAPKDYQFGGLQRLKGVRGKARKVDVSAWQQEQFRSYDWMLGHGIDGRIDVATITKHISHLDTKSVSTETGWREPHRLDA